MSTKIMTLALAALMVLCAFTGCKSGGDASKESAPTNNESSTQGGTSSAGDSQGEEEPRDFLNYPYMDLLPAQDLGGAEVDLYDLNGWSPDDPNESLTDEDREARRERVEFVEKKYNCKLNFVTPPEASWEARMETTISEYASGKMKGDIMMPASNWMGGYIANGILYPLSPEEMAKKPYDPDYLKDTIWYGECYGLGKAIGTDGMWYKKDMIEKAGMEKTPTEMFAEGHWNYDDFYNYIMKLQAGLDEGEFAFYTDPWYWILFASTANGTDIITSDGKPNYMDEGIVEALETLKKLWDAGVCMPADAADGGGYEWYTTMGSPSAQKCAMLHGTDSKKSDRVDRELGYVPYPWGSKVTIGETDTPEAYKTLSDNYQFMQYYMANLCLTSLVKGRFEDPTVLLDIAMQLETSDDWINKVVGGYYNKQKGDDGETTLQYTDVCDTRLEAEIKTWGLTRNIYGREPSINGLLSFEKGIQDIYTEGKSIRSSLEELMSADTAALKDLGWIKD